MADYSMKNYYNSNEYEKGIEYASHPEIRESFSEWDYLFLSKCLYRTKRYHEYLDLYKEFHKRYPDCDMLDDNMGWSLYHTSIKDFDFYCGNIQQYLKQIDFILSHSSDSEYSPRKFIASLAAENIIKKNSAEKEDYELADKYLSMIDPMTLDLTEYESNVSGRVIKTASSREKWYNRKTKALVELGRYDECLKYIDLAFEKVDHFHNNCNHWLNYRKAQSYSALGDLDTAEQVLKMILKSFKHWCFYEQLFSIYEKRGNAEIALQYGCICSTEDREHRLRVSFYKKFADFLTNNNYRYEAALHLRLVELIYAEEGWNSFKLPDGFSYPDSVSSLDKKSVLKELEDFWNLERDRGIEYHEGVITAILPNGKSGFIQDVSGSQYYFNVRDFTGRVRDADLQAGVKVCYALEERLDKKKNEMKLNAVRITII